ncbi:hypothetical protein JO84_gp170 [Aureococcus anophagefferens virus]|uniref:Cell division protein ZapB n=1 Tax=Aureococcus anophagefferens virus TaxID=1474867 RepID=A0A076FH14_9VIRU|nr:hypothetical protein JO84_gp170 [Aureococcus anophagefferens virus]AII17027.1 hypothetical protein AaV_305 [Aureococcus anophagefferens virus]UOG94219.1 hypothetical protein MKD35_178 [Aureococcus anophagefferens virus]
MTLTIDELEEKITLLTLKISNYFEKNRELREENKRLREENEKLKNGQKSDGKFSHLLEDKLKEMEGV